MSTFTDYLENGLLNHVFGGSDFVRPATLYIGLSTTTVADDGTNITEPSGDNSYARVAVTNNSTNFPAASGGIKGNGTAITFPMATDSWGTVTYFFISDASSGGNILAYGQLETAKAVSNRDVLSFDAGDLLIGLL